MTESVGVASVPPPELVTATVFATGSAAPACVAANTTVPVESARAGVAGVPDVEPSPPEHAVNTATRPHAATRIILFFTSSPAPVEPTPSFPLRATPRAAPRMPRRYQRGHRR